MKNLDEAELKDIMSYPRIIEDILEYVKEHWEGNIKPKGYTEFTKDYDDYDGMEELDHKTLEDSFKGFNDGGASNYPFPIRISLPHVAYDDRGQGRDPLETLLGAVLAQGLIIGQRRGYLTAQKAADRLKKDIKYEVSVAKELGKEVRETAIERHFETFELFSK